MLIWFVERSPRAGELERAQLLCEKFLGCANHLGFYSEELGSNGQHRELSSSVNTSRTDQGKQRIWRARSAERAAPSGRLHKRLQVVIPEVWGDVGSNFASCVLPCLKRTRKRAPL